MVTLLFCFFLPKYQQTLWLLQSVTDGRRDPSDDDGIRSKAQTQSQHPTVESRERGAKVEAEVNWGMTDRDGADGFQGAEREPMEKSDISGTGVLGDATATII